eukprot:TRINITY_DN2290_c0_g1_i1.p1 TRINITY_DN2290_c0_g1~~TRINITY_DN2290_c0_g1_i1.p1  ORF type:complete len:327 (-),score=61.74 TRINITY_DN2290_c0_g1_i1:64-1044(-)
MEGNVGFPFFGSFGQPMRMFEQRIRRPARPFVKTYKCHSVSFIDKPQLENGNKVILPQSSLHHLASLQECPMQFELHNASAERKSHCGVHEFTADEGMIYMPYWMMQNMLLQEGDTVKIKLVSLPKGTHLKLQPHTTDFFLIPDPKDVLEKALRNFSCLTTNDTIMITYNGKRYYIDVVETKPSPAISVIDTDCEVEITRPLDYREPKRKFANSKSVPNECNSQGTEGGTQKFVPFSGVARRVGVKTSNSSVNEASCQTKDCTSRTASVRRPKSNSTKPLSENIRTLSDAEVDSPKDYFGDHAMNGATTEQPKIQPFTGRKYSLSG